jgi:flagellar export protein FliJ
MKGTTSKLSTVIRVRDLMLKKQQRELSDIEMRQYHENAELTQLRNKHRDAEGAAAGSGKTKAQAMQVSRAFIRSLSRQISQQSAKIDGLKKDEVEKRRQVLETSQAKQMTEVLEERRLLELKKDGARKAQRMMDLSAQRARTGLL